MPGGTRRIRIAPPSAGPLGAPSSSTWNSPASQAATGVASSVAGMYPGVRRRPVLLTCTTSPPDLIPHVRALSRTDRCVFVCPKEDQHVCRNSQETLHHCRRRGLVAVGHLSAARDHQARFGPQRRRAPRSAGEDRTGAAAADARHRRAAAGRADANGGGIQRARGQRVPTEFRVDGIRDSAGFRTLAAAAETAFDRVERGRHAHVSHEAGHRARPRARHRRAGAPHDRAARQCARRRRGGRRAIHPARSDSGRAPGRRRRRSGEADHQVDRAAPADAGRARSVSRTAMPPLQAYDNALPPALEVLPGPADTQGTGTVGLLRRPEGAGGIRQRPARCPPVGRRVQPPGGRLHA